MQQQEQRPMGGQLLPFMGALPHPPRPPIVRQEWCEDPAQYFRRVLDQLIDHIVEVRRNIHDSWVYF
eukprot:1159940-Pelagomonas_calceolata.AAC.14